MNIQRNRNAGFSLTEVLIAAGILSMGFMMLLTLFPLGLQLTAKQTEKTIGTLAAREAYTNASILMQADPAKAAGVLAGGYKDLRELFWTDKDADNVFDNSESDYVADNGKYELSYDPYLFLYPTASDVSDEEKKYNSAILIGNAAGNYAEAIVFACRRVGTVAQFPLSTTDSTVVGNKPAIVGNRPCVLSMRIDNNFVADAELGSLIKIDNAHNAILDIVGLRTFISPDSDFIADNTGSVFRVIDVSSSIGEHYVRIGPLLSGSERESIGKIWFVPPAVGAGKSAAVDVSRQTVRIK